MISDYVVGCLWYGREFYTKLYIKIYIITYILYKNFYLMCGQKFMIKKFTLFL